MERLVVIKDEAFSKMFNQPIPKQKIAWTEQEVLDLINKEGGEKDE